MKRHGRWLPILGMAAFSLAPGLPIVAASRPGTNTNITIHVRNYAGVDPKTLTEAEEVATGIFRKAGLDTRWADIVLTGGKIPSNFAEIPPYMLADIQLNILPDGMSDRIGLSNNVMGLAPGIGPDRRIIYIFNSNVEARFKRLLREQGSARPYLLVSMAKILGHAIAHEVGHLLLSQQLHSAHGIMRGEWGFQDFRDMRCGMLLFTPQQAEFLRADVRSRNTRQDISKVAAIESSALAP